MTITPYGREIEPHVPDKRAVIDSFRRLADRVGADSMGWRYDPVFLSETYPAERHLRAVRHDPAPLRRGGRAQRLRRGLQRLHDRPHVRTGHPWPPERAGQSARAEGVRLLPGRGHRRVQFLRASVPLLLRERGRGPGEAPDGAARPGLPAADRASPARGSGARREAGELEGRAGFAL